MRAQKAQLGRTLKLQATPAKGERIFEFFGRHFFQPCRRARASPSIGLHEIVLPLVKRCEALHNELAFARTRMVGESQPAAR
jgi:hypothetical protein